MVVDKIRKIADESKENEQQVHKPKTGKFLLDIDHKIACDSQHH